jgi:hypothetical protein
MAAISITADNTRIEDGEAATGWSSIGSGPGGASEGAFFYQGSNLFNRKVTSSTGAGFYYAPNSDGAGTQDMTTAAKTAVMVKLIVTDYGGLQSTNGIQFRIGSGTGAYYEYILAGSSSPITSYDQYPVKGGFIIVPVDPNIAGYRNSTTGSPSLTAVDYFGLLAAFASASAKSENVGLDALDLGTGLTVVGGDGVTTDAAFSDILAHDEGTIGNRYGYFTSNNNIYNVFGTITFGTASAVGFTDADKTVVFPDGFFDVGYSGFDFDLQNAASIIDFTSVTMIGIGDSTVVDTRPIINVSGTSGTVDFNSCTFNKFNTITLTSGATITGGTIAATEQLTQASGTIDGVTISDDTAGSGVAFIVSNNPALISDTTFNFSTGHAIEITTAGTYNISGLIFNGYGANATNTAAIYNNSGGAVTLNVSGGGTAVPTVRNGSGATTSIPSTAQISLTNLVNPTEVRIFDNASPQTEITGTETITIGSYVTSVDITSYPAVNIAILDAGATPAVKNIFLENIDLTSGDVAIKVQQIKDRQFDNP